MNINYLYESVRRHRLGRRSLSRPETGPSPFPVSLFYGLKLENGLHSLSETGKWVLGTRKGLTLKSCMLKVYEKCMKGVCKVYEKCMKSVESV